MWFYGEHLFSSTIWADMAASMAEACGNLVHSESLFQTRNINVSFFIMVVVCLLSLLSSYWNYRMYHQYEIRLVDKDTGSSGLTVTSPEEESEPDLGKASPAQVARRRG